MNIQVYDKTQIDQIPWHRLTDRHRVQKVLIPMMLNGTDTYFHNVRTNLMLLQIDDLILPLTVNETDYDNSYVCSPFSHYVSYAKLELSAFTSNSLVEKVGHVCLSGLGKLLQLARINRIVIVNNWMFSTNLYPHLSDKKLKTLTEYLVKRFPSHAILFRSITDYQPANLFSDLIHCGYLPVPSREVFYYRPDQFQSLPTKSRWKIRRDWKRFEESGYELLSKEELNAQHFQRITQLYHMLYIEKYSIYNVQYQPAFFSLFKDDPAFHLKAMIKNNQIDGFFGFYIVNGVMATPLLGYDTTLPIERGLYRMLFGQMKREAHRRQLLLHESAGVPQFKRERGAIDKIEYLMVYAKHLSHHRHITWHLLRQLLERIAVPYMKSTLSPFSNK